MDFEEVRKYVENEKSKSGLKSKSMPEDFLDLTTMQGLRIQKIERGRILCSIIVPQRLTGEKGELHAGAAAALVDLIGTTVVFTTGVPTGVSVEINISYTGTAYVGDEVEIECKILRLGKAIAVIGVELRNCNNGELIAIGRHTKYIQNIRSKI
ncbi:uncharacterized protein LOC127255276 [Andrographis paniculata]|uniref:uncharacterized protein LOC127255276 n=1 Tax=Andrographis paniculata TaxID=175694 RepID=UPI0021E96697|nr:uncharacterized protein LOC127255276 [Andrographis paniculata]